MKKTAVLFAGQGSQYVGMGQDFYDKFDYVKDLYKRASSILGFKVEKILFEQNDLINQTIYTQPCILVTSIAIYTVLSKELNIKTDMVGGFSLGEYGALYASGVFDFDTIIKLIKLRAQFMQEEALLSKGSMAAIIGLPRRTVEKLCKKECTPCEMVKVANYNCSSQFVVGGTVYAVKNLCERAKANGARRAVVLNVNGAFHTSLMKNAAKKMYKIIKQTKYNNPKIPVIMNCNAKYLEIKSLPKLMKKQIQSSIYFEDSIKQMIADGIDTFIEIGPGSVLSGLIKKIDSLKTTISINKLVDLKNLKGEN